jgi:hypothetical protein
MLFTKYSFISCKTMACMRHTGISRLTIIFLALTIFCHCSLCKSTSAAEPEVVHCIRLDSRPFCAFPSTIVNHCAALPSNSVFAQCNIFSLDIGKVTTKQDEIGNSYSSVLFKYSEQNNCFTGTNASFEVLGKCDTFAAYIQFLRQLNTGKCSVLVNSALIGIQRHELVFRNNPNKVVQKLEIPGVYRRITFVPATTNLLLSQPSSVLVKSNNPQRTYLRSGPAVSALSLLELDSSLTVKRENLKPNAAKIRLTRGIGTNSDFLDFPLNVNEQKALFDVLSFCQ